MNRDSGKKILGVAIDIGTSDIKGALLDIEFKKELARASRPNEQGAFGRDVITRLHFATMNKKGPKELKKRAISAINKLLTRLAKEAGVDKNSIRKILAVGNSTMYHLLFMVKADSLARAPFQPAAKKMRVESARKMGIDAAKDTEFKFLPNIAGFVGSDTLAVILSTEINKKKNCSLIMDIGTNGEIVLGSKSKILVTSCACGPAFEGRYVRPGTKLIDLVAGLLDKGIIDNTGRMAANKTALTQENVRGAQVAKAALAAGVEILLRKARIGVKDIDRLYVTGNFGANINVRNAKKIGLIPKDIGNNKITILKDGALSGAKKALLEPKAEKELNRILAICEHVELHKDKDFQDIFAAAMSF
ncbi:MAG: ASKHA domain-containing protein [Candidatus Omnitrophota bacterium]